MRPLQSSVDFVADSEVRLDVFLASVLRRHSRTRLAKLAASDLVLVDGRPRKANFLLKPGMRVSLDEPPPTEPHDLTPAPIPLDVRYEDDELLVVNKPRGLAAHPAASLKQPSLVNALLARFDSLSQAAGAFRPGIVHRLDKETTGLMVVAKTDHAHAVLAKQIEAKTAERRYVAVCDGSFESERFIIDAPIARDRHNRLLMAVDPNGKHAVTHVKRLLRLDSGVLAAIRLETGRTHQIRVHLKAVGHPVLGDKLYAPRDIASGPMQLHAGYLAFDHPTTGERLAIYAEPDGLFHGNGFIRKEDLEHF